MTTNDAPAAPVSVTVTSRFMQDYVATSPFVPPAGWNPALNSAFVAPVGSVLVYYDYYDQTAQTSSLSRTYPDPENAKPGSATPSRAVTVRAERHQAAAAGPAEPTEAFAFGDFRLLVRRRELIAHGVPVTLGQRALDVLLVLVSRHGELVTKHELMDAVWPGAIVEENNLQAHICALRRALGDHKDARRYLLTVAGRGYRFVHPVTRESRTETPDARTPASSDSGRPRHNIPQSLTGLVGREADVEAVKSALARHRLVTLVGAGGKTRLALAVLELAPFHPDEAWLIELAPLASADSIPAMTADILGVHATGVRQHAAHRLPGPGFLMTA